MGVTGQELGDFVINPDCFVDVHFQDELSDRQPHSELRIRVTVR